MSDESSRSQALNLDAARLKSIIDSSPNIAFVWELTEGWPVAFVSRGIERFGYTVDEFMNGATNFEEIVLSEDLDRVGKEVDAAITSGADHLDQTYRLVTRKGDIRWVRDWTEFLRDKEGKALQAQGIILDITNFVTAEERARDFAKFPLENPRPIFRVDCFGDILLSNKAAQTMIEDLSSATTEQREEWKHMLALATDMQIAGRFDLTVGSKIYEFSINHVEGRDYTNLYGDDVTEERHNQVRMVDIANNMPGALLQFTLNPDDSDEIEFLNKRCEDIWGVSAARVKADSSLIWNMVHPDDIDTLRTSVQKSAKGSATWRHEWRIVMPSGDRKWLRGIANPHSRHGGLSVWTVIVFDITTEKSAAKALSSALTQAVRVLSAALEARDPYTAGHEQRVAEISLQLGKTAIIGRIANFNGVVTAVAEVRAETDLAPGMFENTEGVRTGVQLVIVEAVTNQRPAPGGRHQQKIQK